MKIVDIIKKANVETVAKIIGSVIVMHTEGIPIKEAMRNEYPATLRFLQSDMEIDYKLTNADRIRAMSDEELATNMMCPNENSLAEIECNKDDNCNCYECLLQWLQSEAEG